jgi:predicted DNA-binding mobile mystery protein A
MFDLTAYRLAMSSDLNRLRLEQVQDTLGCFSALTAHSVPERGWLKLIRECLGRTQRQQALRLGIAASTLHKAELSEAEERISLGQLRKLADGLDCELVYALVPRKPLTDVVQDRARVIATEEVGAAAHSMGLDAKRPGNERLRKQVEHRSEELLRGRWSDLWR